MSHVARGDNVVVTKGREKGKRGKIKRLVRSKRGKLRVEIEKVMMLKRHTKPTQKDPHGGIQDIEGSIAIDNVSLWCEKCVAGRRTRMEIDDTGRKHRVCVKCAGAFPVPGM